MNKSNIKKLGALLLALAMVVSLITPSKMVQAKKPKVPGQISKEKVTIKVGDTLQLKASSSVKNVKFSWSSTNEKVVKVDKTGVIKGKSYGSARVKVTIKPTGKAGEDYSKCTLTCKVTVKHSFVLSEPELELEYCEVDYSDEDDPTENATTPDDEDEGEDEDNTATVEIEDTSADAEDGPEYDAELIGKYDNKKVDPTKIKWTSSDTTVVTVKDGQVTVIGLGKATITATYNGMKAKCAVSVTEVVEEEFDEDDPNADIDEE